MAAVMDLGDCHRDAVAIPRLAEAGPDSGVVLQPFHPDRLGVDIGVAAVPARLVARIEVEPVVEEAFAGEIMVDAEEVRFPLAALEQFHLLPADAGAEQEVVPAVAAIDAAAQQIEAEPAPLVLVRGLVA